MLTVIWNMGKIGKVFAIAISLLVLIILGPFTFEAIPNYEAETPGSIQKLCADMNAPLTKGKAKIDLIVQFIDGPSQSDKVFVENLDFTIKCTFHVVPALSIQGPTKELEELLKYERVTFIEHNDPVVLDMEMGTWIINATEVWSKIIRTEDGVKGPIDGTGVTVCVVDTGIDAGHPDLDYGDKTIMNVYDAGSGIWLEAENTDTNYGHGTHVAGTVAGNGDASAGARRGVAPGANLIGVTVSIPEEAATPTEDGYIQGLEWVYDHSRPNANPYNIRVVTNSWHSSVGEYDPNMLLTQLIEKLTFDNNIVSTWSAGNDGRDDPKGTVITTSQQGNTPVGIEVAAYERDGSAVTDFSSRGEVGFNHTYPDIGAPGRNIWSTSARRTIISGGSYIGGNVNPYYLAISGTSMSTPHVAGLVALLWQAAPSMTLSELHEDYSGPDYEGWYSNPKTRIHEAEWILEASAILLPRDEEHGNVAGDTNSTGWDGKPIDYVQGYGLVDAKKAVGISLTLERLRAQYPLRKISVRDAISAYARNDVDGAAKTYASEAVLDWSGEFSRYNDQAGNPLSAVNQTKYVIVPQGANTAKISMTYSALNLNEFKAADIAFTIDYNDDGNIDYQSDLSVNSGGIDTAELDASSEGKWTFGIIGMGIKLPRPLKGINYVELRIEYDISITFYFSNNGSSTLINGNAMYAPLFPGMNDPGEGKYTLEVGHYDLCNLSLPEVSIKEPASEDELPFWYLAFVIILVLALIVYLRWRKRKRK